MWVTDFVFKSDNERTSSLYSILRPYCSALDETLVQGGTEKVVSIQDLMAILEGKKIEPKIKPETIALGAQVMGGVILFLKMWIADKEAPDPVIEPEPVVEPPTEPTPEEPQP